MEEDTRLLLLEADLARLNAKLGSLWFGETALWFYAGFVELELWDWTTDDLVEYGVRIGVL